MTAGTGISNPTRTKARQKGWREKSFLSAKLSIGEIKEHLPPSPKVVSPLSEQGRRELAELEIALVTWK